MIFLDFETRSAIDLIKMGGTRYAMDESTQALCMSWLFDDQPAEEPEDVPLWHRDHPWISKSETPEELIQRIRDGELVEAHNARFEWLIWNYVLRREFPEFDCELKLEQLRCSAAKASCMSLPRGLGDAVAAVNLEQRKDADGNRLINKLSKPMRTRRRKIAPGEYAWKTAVRYEILDLFAPGTQTPGWAALYKLGEELAGDYAAPPTKRPAAIRDVMHRMRDEDKYFVENGTGVYARTDVPVVQKDVPPDREERRAVILAMAERQQEQQLEVQWCEEEIEHRRNWRYNQQDVRSERGLSDYCPEMSDRELQYWQMDFRMNDRGIRLDLDSAKAAIGICDKETLRLNDEMVALTDGAVLGGSKRIPFRKWANEQIAAIAASGYQVGPIPDTKADTLSFMLYGVPTKAGEEAKAAAKDRMEAQWASWGELGKKLHRAMMICLEVNRSSIAKYRQMIGSVCPDGRLHDIMLYNGADRTGRWSGKGVQPHNFVRGYTKDMSDIWDVLIADDGPEMVEIVTGDLMLPAMAKACRGALTASEGKELYTADFNAIEARKLAWMAGCDVLLSLFLKNGDPYCDMASAIYKREITKADKSERQLGKKAILGLGYAMGWEKFQATVWAEEGIWLEDEFCQEVVKIYRKTKYPEIPKLWKATNEAAINAVVEGGEWFAGGNELGEGAVSYFMSASRDFLHCRLPSGRLLAYLYPEVHTKVSYRYNAINERGKACVLMFPAKVGVPMNRVAYHAAKLAEKQRKTLTGDPPESFLQPHLSFMGRDTYTRQWKRNGTHGGTLVENYDQASSRDLLAESMWRVDEHPDFDLLLSIHDEVIAEAPIGTATLKEFEAMMAVVPWWAPGMPIAAEGWIGPRLRK